MNYIFNRFTIYGAITHPYDDRRTLWVRGTEPYLYR